MPIGRVYKVIHLDSELCYIGSTLDTIRSRWSGHKSKYKQWVKEGSRACSLYPYMGQYGVDRFKMVLIREYRVADKLQLRVFEQLAISRHKCVNVQAAFQIIGKRSMARHHAIIDVERAAGYRSANRDRIAAQQNQKHYCECGGKFTQQNRTKHLGTAKHIRWAESQ